ncbi:class II fructose-bisphosphate aldolase [Anaerostipes sp.]|uniref:class II fructose-bisphosphate aldolase n=1 Tax=Anaerostipes sp. TaxID=1872530 RepID=UPI0025B9D325|nr:class II fructose-bisphosphate aldolase [Anaerostipes sp.]MBS7007150.1 class II fructose-bisphosphate aldolase [Anaerostipes sp.]
MLVTMGELLAGAKEGGYAVAAANVFTGRTVEACFMAAAEMNAPVIIACTPYVQMEELSQAARMYEKKYPQVLAALHLDHGKEYEDIQRALRCGFTSVMLDKSTLPYEENVKAVKEAVRAAHAVGVTVEAELGHVGKGAEYEETRDSGLTRKEEAAGFVQETGVDCLAVAVGTSHGVYKGRAHLNFDLLSELSREVSVPLVLHGGSNTGEDKLKKAVTLGIQKINLSTDLSSEYLKGVKRFEEEHDPLFDEDGTLIYPGNRTVYANQALTAGAKAYQEILKSYMKVFGSEGKTLI